MTKPRMQMSEQEKSAQDLDRKLWLEAWNMYKKWGKRRLIAWLETHENVEHREDIRRRLNVIRISEKNHEKSS